MSQFTITASRKLRTIDYAMGFCAIPYTVTCAQDIIDLFGDLDLDLDKDIALELDAPDAYAVEWAFEALKITTSTLDAFLALDDDDESMGQIVAQVVGQGKPFDVAKDSPNRYLILDFDSLADRMLQLAEANIAEGLESAGADPEAVAEAMANDLIANGHGGDLHWHGGVFCWQTL